MIHKISLEDRHANQVTSQPQKDDRTSTFKLLVVVYLRPLFGLGFPKIVVNPVVICPIIPDHQ